MARARRASSAARAGKAADSAPPALAEPSPDISANLSGLAGDGDELLGQIVPGRPNDAVIEHFHRRDPFTADYLDSFKAKAGRRPDRGPRVDQELRADLVAKPWLTERPEEAALRGAAAVWRSLQEQMRSGTEELLDRSDVEELRLMQRELEAQKMLLESICKGFDDAIRRVRLRLDRAGPPTRGVAGGPARRDG